MQDLDRRQRSAANVARRAVEVSSLVAAGRFRAASGVSSDFPVGLATIPIYSFSYLLLCEAFSWHDDEVRYTPMDFASAQVTLPKCFRAKFVETQKTSTCTFRVSHGSSLEETLSRHAQVHFLLEFSNTHPLSAKKRTLSEGISGRGRSTSALLSLQRFFEGREELGTLNPRSCSHVQFSFPRNFKTGQPVLSRKPGETPCIIICPSISRNTRTRFRPFLSNFFRTRFCSSIFTIFLSLSSVTSCVRFLVCLSV